MSKLGQQLKTQAVIVNPRITEKATYLAGADKNPAYVFTVAPRATKLEIKAAIQTKYKVTPVRVNIINLPAKKVRRGRKVGIRSGIKKAVIYLKPGEKIEII